MPRILAFQTSSRSSGGDDPFFSFSLMEDFFYYRHVKLLAFDLLSLTVSSSDPPTFSRNGMPVSRVESVGVITSRDYKPSKFLKFSLDDGTGCVCCILWLNHLNSAYFSRRDPGCIQLLADVARRFAAEVQIGKVSRVRGRIGSYRGELQITVSDVVIERDPNAEILHWLDCLRLSRQCYDVVNRTSS